MHSDSEAVQKIVVLGAGSWGLTLAFLLANAGKTVSLWSRQPEKAEMLRQKRRIEKPLAIDLPTRLEISSDLDETLDQAAAALICCTSQTMRSLCTTLSDHYQNVEAHNLPIFVSAAKGLELDSLKRMSEVIADVFPQAQVCALSGPNLAAEMVQGLPTAAVVASSHVEAAAFVQKLLTVSRFRVYLNADIVGVELGGTLKNIIAIAAGSSDGFGMGVNAKAALLTRGLAEMTRLAMTLGAQAPTLAGLAGMGDLFATCSSASSRNYQLGYELAKGKSIEEIKAEIGAVIEGITTTEAVCELSKRLSVQLPIAELVQTILSGNIEPEKAIMALMARPLASE